MTKSPLKLSDTGRAVLTLASTRPDRLVRPPTLPTAAARQVVRSLLNNGFVEEVPAPIEDSAYTWRTTDDASALMLRVTHAGLVAAGVTPALTEIPQTIEAFTQQVLGFLTGEGCNATMVEEAEVQIMLEDGFANGRSAGQVARDIITWLTEEEAGQRKRRKPPTRARRTPTGRMTTRWHARPPPWPTPWTPRPRRRHGQPCGRRHRRFSTHGPTKRAARPISSPRWKDPWP